MKGIVAIVALLLLLSSLAAAEVDESEVIDALDTASAEEISDEIVDETEISEEDSLDEDPGALPGSFGWTLKRLGENIGLAFTFNQQAKAQKEISYAKRRLLEANKAAEEGNEGGVEKAQEEYEALLAKVRARIANENSETGLNEAAILEARLRQHQVIAEAIRARIAAANLTEEQMNRISEHIANILQNQNQSRNRIKEQRENIKQALKRIRNLSDDEVDDLDDEADVAAESGADITEAGQEVSAAQFIRILNAKIEEAEERIAGLENATAAQEMIDLAKELRDQAKAAYDEGDFEKAKDLALEGRKIAMDAAIRSRLKSVVKAKLEVSNEARERLRQQLEEKAKNLTAMKQERAENTERIMVRIEKVGALNEAAAAAIKRYKDAVSARVESIDAKAAVRKVTAAATNWSSTGNKVSASVSGVNRTIETPAISNTLNLTAEVVPPEEPDITVEEPPITIT
ncbi:hypothetical protein JXB11_00865 [Candidatus Woesearchaeota archaeon]|nr:hypothetical protein [Candidatus Woesearchaeota archaeon]